MWGAGLWEGYGCGVINQGVSDERVPGATYYNRKRMNHSSLNI